MARHVRKGDLVVVTAGNDRGKTGEVLRMLTDRDRVIVKGVNVGTKHLKPTQANPRGGVIQREMPIHISNVSPAVDGQPSRVRFETKSDGSKVRVAEKRGKELHTLRKPRKTTKTSSKKSK